MELPQAPVRASWFHTTSTSVPLNTIGVFSILFGYRTEPLVMKGAEVNLGGKLGALLEHPARISARMYFITPPR
jgi:hypothetical protein